MDLKDIRDAKAIVANVRSVFETPQGKEVMKFLEESCGWYESIFDPDNRDRILINAGRREVVATIHTLLRLTPEQITVLAKQKEEQNAG